MDFLRDPVWGGVGVLITLLITVGGQVILRRRRDESSRGSNARGFLRTFSAPKALIYAGIGCMFLGFVLPSDTWGSGGLFLLSVGVIFAAFLALKGLVRMIIDRRIGLPPTKDAARSDLVVGDKASIESGGSLTVYTFESPAASSEYIEPDPGKEYSAIEVEWCAGLSRGEELERVRSHYLELQMPDNTRASPRGNRIREPYLPDTMLLPDDCVRGWITFQTPKGVKPAFVMFTGRESVVKWALQDVVGDSP